MTMTGSSGGKYKTEKLCFLPLIEASFPRSFVRGLLTRLIYRAHRTLETLNCLHDAAAQLRQGR